MFFDGSKAVRELGMPQSPIDAALLRAVEWFTQRGYVRAATQTQGGGISEAGDPAR
jgi:hypothetical protein